jgi:hypothetical protein
LSFSGNEERYLELIRGFLSSKICGAEFCEKFSALWKADRDEDYDKAMPLIDAYNQGARAGEESRAKLVELTGYAICPPLISMLDDIFVSCDLFDPTLETIMAIDEEQLKEDVAAKLARYESTHPK